MIASVAPIWDGNETWLVMGGIGMFTAFPTAFAIIFPALYFPVLAMLLGLLFRGVAFEFRATADTSRRHWDRAFFWGSLIATFAQGCVLGKYVLGFDVVQGEYRGTVWDWVHPFVLATGVGLVAGYVLLGATWLVMKTEGPLHEWSRRMARLALVGVLGFIALVSIWTPLLHERIAERWVSWPNIAFLAPPAHRHSPAGNGALARAGPRPGHMAVLRRDGPLPSVLSRSCDQPVSIHRAACADAVGCRSAAEHSGVPADRDAVPDPDHLHLHGMVVLGVPRQGARRHGLPLIIA
jgi:cytochrome bd-type quinol oxidase subunit 2